MEGWFTEKLAFQLRRSTPGAEREERLQQVEGATYRKDLKRKNDGSSKEQKKVSMTGHLGSKEGHGEIKVAQNDMDEIAKNMLAKSLQLCLTLCDANGL